MKRYVAQFSLVTDAVGAAGDPEELAALAAGDVAVDVVGDLLEARRRQLRRGRLVDARLQLTLLDPEHEGLALGEPAAEQRPRSSSGTAVPGLPRLVLDRVVLDDVVGQLDRERVRRRRGACCSSARCRRCRTRGG